MDINRITAGGLGQVFSRIFGLEEMNAVQTVAPEVMPTTSPWERPEFWVLTGGNLCHAGAYQAAGGAGTRTVFQLNNPSTSGMILVVELVKWASFIAATPTAVYLGVNLSSSLNALATAISSNHSDPRRAPGNNVTLGIAGRVTHEARATGGLITPQQLVFAANDELEQPIILPPLFGLQVSATQDNLELACNFIWREKPISQALQLTF